MASGEEETQESGGEVPPAKPLSPAELIEQLKGKRQSEWFTLPTEGQIEQIRHLWGVDGRSKTEISSIVGLGTSVVNEACKWIPKGKPPAGGKGNEGEAKAMKDTKDETVQTTVAAPGKTAGYMEDVKRMVRGMIAQIPELEVKANRIGMAGLLAALSKSGMTMDEYRAIATTAADDKDALVGIGNALDRAGDTIFSALEAYNADVLPKLDYERKAARLYANQLELQLEDMKKQIEPMFRLENMIYKLALLSGTSRVDPTVITELIDRWLQMQLPVITAEMA